MVGDRLIRRLIWPITGLALALRLWQLNHGLPDLLEEAHPFKQAFAMWGWAGDSGDLNPHFFNYPSLTLYLQLGLQKLHYLGGLLSGQFGNPADYWLAFQTDPTNHIIIGRGMGVLADLATVLAAWRLGERLHRGSGLAAALVLATAPVMVFTSRSIFTDSVMAALALWSLERTLRWYHDGGRIRLLTAAGLAGLAAGAKYPGAFALLPIAAAMLWRLGWRRMPVPALAAAAISLGAFIITTPFSILDWPAFWDGFRYEFEHVAVGHLGSIGGDGRTALGAGLIRNLGWPLLALAVLGVIHAVSPRGRKEGDRSIHLIIAALLPGLLSLLFARVYADRYLLLVLPGLTLLAVHSLGYLMTRRPWPGTPAIGWGLCFLCLSFPVGTGLFAVAAERGSTQIEARHWFEAQVQDSDMIIQEHYGASLWTPARRGRIQSEPQFGKASEAERERFLAKPVFRSVNLPMFVSGQISVDLELEGGGREEALVFEHASLANEIFYEPALLHGADFLVLTSTMRDRYTADPGRYPKQNRFYTWVDGNLTLVKSIASGDGRSGPRIQIYDLQGGKPLRRIPTLDPLWWARSIPEPYRAQVESIMAPGSRTDGRLLDALGRPAPWLKAQGPLFELVLDTFLTVSTDYLASTNKNGPALQLALSILIMEPDNGWACMSAAICATNLGNRPLALEIIDRGLANQDPGSPDAGKLRELQERIMELGR